MNVFRRGDSYVFALTYGADVNWVKNVVAAGECELRTGGRDMRLVEPELFVDPKQRPDAGADPGLPEVQPRHRVHADADRLTG